MEMSVCGEEEGEKIGVLLTDFYNGMGTAEEAAAKEAKAKEMEAKLAALAAQKKAEEQVTYRAVHPWLRFCQSCSGPSRACCASRQFLE